MDDNTLALLTLIVNVVIAPLVTRIWWKIEDLHARVAYVEGVLNINNRSKHAPAAKT